MISRTRLTVGLMALALALSPAITTQPAFAQRQGEAMKLPVDPAPLRADNPSNATFSIEVADDDGERSQGLMWRTDLPDDRGMLFVFNAERPLAFWMKNTPLPLDLVFIGQNGEIVDVLKGEPFSEAPISPAEPSRFVLELKRGTAAKNGLGKGVRLRHPTIDAVAGG